MIHLSQRQARRLALVHAGLLKPEWSELPKRAAGRGRRARDGALAVLQHFGYLQLDSIPVAGARTHGIVLLSRLEGFAPKLAEDLLKPGEPVFEYWGHEACWLPMELYPVLGFRRKEFVVHPWYGDVLGEHPETVEHVLQRIRDEGPLRSADFEGESKAEMWHTKEAKKVALALWSEGTLAIRRRRHFHRYFDLAERVIPEDARWDMPEDEAVRVLLLRALRGHGWASTGTLAATWRLKKMRGPVDRALAELQENGDVVPATAEDGEGRRMKGWLPAADLEILDQVERLRPRRERGVLLSPFDPLLWDRARVQQLFDFEQVLEIYKPAAERKYGYYVLPVLAGENLVSRVDLKADRKAGTLTVVARHDEPQHESPATAEAVRSALARYASALELEIC